MLLLFINRVVVRLENPTNKQKEAIKATAQKVLDAQAELPGSSLADLDKPLTMLPALVKAHNKLGKADDMAYRSQAFVNETNRIEFLFELYDKYTAEMIVSMAKKGSNRNAF